MKSLLGLVQSPPCRLDIEFKDAEGRPYKRLTTIKSKKEETEEVPVYSNKDTIMGEIRVTPMTTKKIEHQSIKVQLLGQIELASERGTAHEFVSLVRELAPPGELTSSKVFPFEFRSVEMQYDSFRGQQVRCRYLLRVTVTGKGMTQDSRRDFNIWVTNYEEPSDAAAPIKMEVGIEDCLHIEFEYDRARYHLKDVVVGRIYFLLVRIKLKHMEIEIRRKETTGAGSSAHSESETLAKYEIMDGAPVRGESVPIRLYLSPYDLAPTYKDIHNKFSVRYYLNLVLVDEEDRRYFKQQEITLYRKAEDRAAPAGSGAPGQGNFVAAPPKLPNSQQMASAASDTLPAPTQTAAPQAPAATYAAAVPAAVAAAANGVVPAVATGYQQPPLGAPAGSSATPAAAAPQAPAPAPTPAPAATTAAPPQPLPVPVSPLQAAPPQPQPTSQSPLSDAAQPAQVPAPSSGPSAGASPEPLTTSPLAASPSPEPLQQPNEASPLETIQAASSSGTQLSNKEEKPSLPDSTPAPAAATPLEGSSAAVTGSSALTTGQPPLTDVPLSETQPVGLAAAPGVEDLVPLQFGDEDGL